MEYQTTAAFNALSEALIKLIDYANALKPAMLADQKASDDAAAVASSQLTAANDTITGLSAKVTDLNAQVVDLQKKLAAGSIITIAVDTTGKTVVNAAVQKFLDQAKTATAEKPLHFTIPAGDYLVDAVQAFWPRNYTTIDIDPNAKFHVVPNDEPAYQVWNCERLTGTHIHGGQYFGDRDAHTYKPVLLKDGTVNVKRSTHEWGFAIRVSGCTDCSFRADYIENFTGDGYAVGAFKDVYPWVRSTGVLLFDSKINDCRRQGLSVGGVNGLTVRGLTITNIGVTNGTSPQCGVDLEPDSDELTDANGKVTRAASESAWCNNVRFENTTIDGADVYGVNVFHRVDGVYFDEACKIINSKSVGIQNVDGKNITVKGSYIGFNGNTGLVYAKGTTGKVSGVTFERNAKKAARKPPITKPGVVAGTLTDLRIGTGAVVDLKDANTYK